MGMLFRDMGTSTGIKCDSLISSSLNTDIPHSLIFLKADFLVFLEPKKKKKKVVVLETMVPLKCLTPCWVILQAPLAMAEKLPPGASIVVQPVKTTLPHWCPRRVPVQVLSAPLLVQLPTKALGKAEKCGLSAWTSAANGGCPVGVPGSWLQLGPSLAIVNQQMEDPLPLLKNK